LFYLQLIVELIFDFINRPIFYFGSNITPVEKKGKSGFVFTHLDGSPIKNSKEN